MRVLRGLENVDAPPTSAENRDKAKAKKARDFMLSAVGWNFGRWDEE